MALSCNPADIVRAAACFKCIPPKSAPLVKAYLLCQTAKIADPTSPCSAPSAPTALQVLNTSNTTIKVGWKQTKNTGSFITGYKVFWGTTSGGPYTSNSGVIPTLPRNYTITGLTAGTTYFVVVVALSAVPGCQSANSNQASGTTSGAVPNGLLNTLVHYYQLQEAAAPFADSGSNPTSLSYLNAGADFSRVAGHVQAFAAHYNGAGAFNGISSVVNCPFDFSGDGTGNKSMSFCTWFLMSSVQPSGVGGPIVGIWGPAGATESWLLFRPAANAISFNAIDNGLVQRITANQAATDDNWHLWVGGFDFTNGVIFSSVDGGAIITAACATLHSINSNPFTMLTWTAGGTPERQGSISDVGVWNGRVLNATDIANLWNGGAGLPFNQFTV